MWDTWGTSWGASGSSAAASASAAQNIVVGSDHDFSVVAEKDGVVWDITGGTVLLYLRDPSGNWSAPYAATITDGPAGLAHYQVDETVLDEAGAWGRQWDITVAGVTLRTEIIEFTVAPFRPAGPAATADALSLVAAALAANAAGPREAETDAGRVQQHSLKDQIEADRYLASKAAALAGRPGIRFRKLVPPGAD